MKWLGREVRTKYLGASRVLLQNHSLSGQQIGEDLGWKDQINTSPTRRVHNHNSKALQIAYKSLWFQFKQAYNTDIIISQRYEATGWNQFNH